MCSSRRYLVPIVHVCKVDQNGIEGTAFFLYVYTGSSVACGGELVRYLQSTYSTYIPFSEGFRMLWKVVFGAREQEQSIVSSSPRSVVTKGGF